MKYIRFGVYFKAAASMAIVNYAYKLHCCYVYNPQISKEKGKEYINTHNRYRRACRVYEDEQKEAKNICRIQYTLYSCYVYKNNE